MSIAARPAPASAAMDGMGPAAFTFLATTATVMGFVFLAPAGALLALGALWFGADTVWQRGGRPATGSLLVFGGIASIMGFVFLAPAGALIAAATLWLAMGRPLPGKDRTATVTSAPAMPEPSGNAAFDAYRAETLKRLDDEREAFSRFVTRLRESRDRAEFDQYLADKTWASQTKPRDVVAD